MALSPVMEPATPILIVFDDWEHPVATRTKTDKTSNKTIPFQNFITLLSPFF
jgi:hypothetical protein